jgi:hypothetical protein
MRVPQSGRARGAILVGLLAIASVAAWAALGRHDERSAEGTVRAFFDARQVGDCTRLLDLLSGESWSDGGRLDRDEFLEQCADVVDEYRPELGDVEVVSDDGDRVVVNLSIPDVAPPQPLPGRQEGVLVQAPNEGELAYETGRLVREDGEWKVEADLAFLRIGRSVEQTVRGFVNAFNDGDCESLIDYLSERAWSDDGGLDRAEYIDRCVEEADARLALPDQLTAIGEPDEIEVSVDRDDRGTAVAVWDALPANQVPVETVTLVREGFEWKLDGPPDTVERVEFEALLLADEPLPGFRRAEVERISSGTESSSFFDIEEGDDIAERRGEAGFERGAIGTFRENDESITRVTVLLYEFEEDEGARTYAEFLANRVGDQADSASPAPVPSVTEVRGAVTYCADDGCLHATAATGVAVDGRFVVAVELADADDPPTGELIGRTEGVVHAQLDRL